MQTKTSIDRELDIAIRIAERSLDSQICFELASMVMPKRTYQPNYSPPIDPRDQEIKALQRELSDLRHDLIRLQPQDIAGLLTSYYGCTMRAEWERNGSARPPKP
ncbi:hypothetical protein ABIB85_007538 [Bradyrhizobium sp. JR1.5]|uniref:hypothetical protein n=1 Tax=unclassified Bradyrhizobium TaxID=2631580 RepID=UPI0033942429